MSFTREATQTLTLSSSAGAASGTMSTHLHGLLHGVYVDPSTDMGANATVTIVRATATGDVLLVATNTTKTGKWYFPRGVAIGTTENTIGSSAVCRFPLNNEQLKVVASATSTLGSETVLVRTIVV